MLQTSDDTVGSSASLVLMAQSAGRRPGVRGDRVTPAVSSATASACVLPADPESGKTTLTTGLVRAGYAYLTDEAMSFDWETGEIEPYPKPLSIDPGSQFLFPELAPPPPAGLRRASPTGSGRCLRRRSATNAVGGRCRAKSSCSRSTKNDVETRIEPIPRAEALVELAKNTFRFREHPRRALDSLARVIAEVECYRLSVGDLDAACTLIDELMSAIR